MADEKYEGWKNYPTWNYKLWIDNDQGSQEYWRTMAEDAYDSAKKEGSISKKDMAWMTLADMLKEALEENNPITEPTMYSDMMQYAIDSIDYREIAKALIDEMLENRNYKPRT